MNLQFNTTISDAKFSFITEVALRNAIVKAGRKNIVFVEGYDDKVIFEILYAEYLDKLSFIEVSLEEAKRLNPHQNLHVVLGWNGVKQCLTACIKNLPTEKRFYGVIDRDLKTDQQVKAEKEKPCYEGRLFIFWERYTLENYFIEINILQEFLKGQSIKHKKLIPIINERDKFEKEIFQPVLVCLKYLAVANLTLHFFDNTQCFLEDNAPCDKAVIIRKLIDKLKVIEQGVVKSQFQYYEQNVNSVSEVHKFASAKKYFAYHFNKKLKENTDVNIQLNNHKSELARILKNQVLPKDFRDLLSLILQQASHG
jgi:hypothetical protein